MTIIPKLTAEQKKQRQKENCMKWKEAHKEAVLEYHKKYNKEHEINKQLGGQCDACRRYYKNISQHMTTKKHKRNLAKEK